MSQICSKINIASKIELSNDIADKGIVNPKWMYEQMFDFAGVYIATK